jgi:hypothetical protein
MLFAENYNALSKRLNIELTPHELSLSMLTLVQNKKWQDYSAITGISNFDAWGSSRLKSLCVEDYLIS